MCTIGLQSCNEAFWNAIKHICTYERNARLILLCIYLLFPFLLLFFIFRIAWSTYNQSLMAWFFIAVPSIKHIYDTKLMHTQCPELMKCITREQFNHLDKESEILKLLGNAVLTAAKFGNVEVIAHCVESYPQVIWYYEEKYRSMLHIAVTHRQVKTFKLLRGYGARTKKLACWWEESTGNNILHQVAISAPPHVLNSVSSAALQIQRELQWFKVIHYSLP